MNSMQLYDLEEAIQHLSDGLDAIEIMVMGLEQEKAAHAGGFYAVWRYLNEANQEVRRQLDICIHQGPTCQSS